MADDFAMRMMKKLGWTEGKGLGKEEDGRVRPVQVEQKQNVKGIGFGTEGAFTPWWDDLYTKTAISSGIKTMKVKKDKKEKRNKKSKKDKKSIKKDKSKDSKKRTEDKKDKDKKSKSKK